MQFRVSLLEHRCLSQNCGSSRNVPVLGCDPFSYDTASMPVTSFPSTRVWIS
jgi:hypothetical protein